jgi:hypothetical protein
LEGTDELAERPTAFNNAIIISLVLFTLFEDDNEEDGDGMLVNGNDPCNKLVFRGLRPTDN